MKASAVPESIGVFYKVLLVYRFEYPDKSSFYKLVFKTWYPQRTSFIAPRLMYLLPPDRLRYVCHPMQPSKQISQGGIKVLGIHILGHFVNAGSGVFPEPLKAFPHQLLVHQMI
jgi:hypothetical protein